MERSPPPADIAVSIPAALPCAGPPTLVLPGSEAQPAAQSGGPRPPAPRTPDDEAVCRDTPITTSLRGSQGYGMWLETALTTSSPTSEEIFTAYDSDGDSVCSEGTRAEDKEAFLKTVFTQSPSAEAIQYTPSARAVAAATRRGSVKQK